MTTPDIPKTPLATGGTIPDRHDTGLARALSQPCQPVAPTPEPWPLKPGDVVTHPESGSTAWLDAAPVGTVVRDRDMSEWKRLDCCWTWSGMRRTAESLDRVYGPLTVVSVPEPKQPASPTPAETTGAVERAADTTRRYTPPPPGVQAAAVALHDMDHYCDGVEGCAAEFLPHARKALTAALDAVDWPDTIAGHMTITLTDMHRCACHAPLAPSADRYMAEQAHLAHLSAIIRAALLGTEAGK